MLLGVILFSPGSILGQIVNKGETTINQPVEKIKKRALVPPKETIERPLQEVKEEAIPEDKGKDESEKTNIAEILIEKHRNGPTGKVELYFDQKTTTFLNLEKSNLSEFTQSKVSDDLDEF